MNKVTCIGIAAASALALASCSSIPGDTLSTALTGVTSGGGYTAPATSPAGSAASASLSGSTAAPVDFQSGEILCTTDRKMAGAHYNLARILTPASTATKNQAEVVYIDGGAREWVNYAVNSRKATKADLTVGANVFYCVDWDEISSDQYRKLQWTLGVVTSTEDLYKGRIEISGDSYKIEYVRVPTDPVK